MMIQNICYQNPGQLKQIVTYDLKGSQTGRKVVKTEEKQKQIKEKINNQLNVEQVLKDIDFQNIQQNIQISDQQQLKAIKNQIFKDAEFLSSLKLMDYSLVISQYVVSEQKKESNTSNKDFDDFSEQSDKDEYLNNHFKQQEQKAKSFENSQIQYFKKSQNAIKNEKKQFEEINKNQNNEDDIISNSQPQNFYFISDYKQKQKYDLQNDNHDSLINKNNQSINNNINDQETDELMNEEQQFHRQKSQINLCNNGSLFKNIPLKKQISDQINQFPIKQIHNNQTHKQIINPIIINQNKGHNQFENNIKKSNFDKIQGPQKITNYSQFQLQNRQKIFYYIGIIDYLQTYNTFKKLQYYTDFSGKGSSKPPDKYGKTFIQQNINIFKLQNQFQSQQE
ncbi:hypothetical protein PPERSA_11195 [Pseudocohnilembus persalinus]|uniref:PIPK domain-containing protein n=1 Tax=Pseudocohnilembus persalinus TaxID=266149 RepID=A0A0V0QZI5_PSEPJ|nr:hypothetical protein PPERSA_11195 [Pseudocohnilembus persalinus]|eukprot:KRX07646.1 hypothetical protein PPERSA_11195 [Pseudocohnilembus persalinus]